MYLGFGQTELLSAPAGVGKGHMGLPDCQPVCRTELGKSGVLVPARPSHLQSVSQAKKAPTPSDQRSAGRLR